MARRHPTNNPCRLAHRCRLSPAVRISLLSPNGTGYWFSGNFRPVRRPQSAGWVGEETRLGASGSVKSPGHLFRLPRRRFRTPDNRVRTCWQNSHRLPDPLLGQALRCLSAGHRNDQAEAVFFSSGKNLVRHTRPGRSRSTETARPVESELEGCSATRRYLLPSGVLSVPKSATLRILAWQLNRTIS